MAAVTMDVMCKDSATRIPMSVLKVVLSSQWLLTAGLWVTGRFLEASRRIRASSWLLREVSIVLDFSLSTLWHDDSAFKNVAITQSLVTYSGESSYTPRYPRSLFAPVGIIMYKRNFSESNLAESHLPEYKCKAM